MIKKQLVVALAILLLIPVVVVLGGWFFSLIDPEIAAGHPNYTRNYHLLNLLKLLCFWGGGAVAGVLWLLVCLLILRSKKRSHLWLLMAPLGPVGLAVLAMLNDLAPAETDSYARFVGKLNLLMRGAYELFTFAAVWVLAYEAMVMNRELIIRYQAVTTGVSVQQIMDVQNASSGMWAFGEGNEVLFLVALLYLLRPIVFGLVAVAVGRRATPRAR